MRKLLSLAAGTILMAGSAFAQPYAALVIQTNHPEAVVFVDSLRLGYASQQHFRVPVSAQEVRLVAGSETSWMIAPVTQPLSLEPDSVYQLRTDFPYHYQVRSVPFGADVYVESGGARRRIGETPLLYTSLQPLDSTIVVERPGFAAQRAEPGEGVWNEVEVVLQTQPRSAGATEVAWRPPSAPRNWIDYAAGGLAVAAGALAVHYKFKADRLHDEYQNSGDPSLRSTINSYDLRAGVSLGAMQIGVGVLAVRFAIRN